MTSFKRLSNGRKSFWGSHSLVFWDQLLPVDRSRKELGIFWKAENKFFLQPCSRAFWSTQSQIKSIQMSIESRLLNKLIWIGNCPNMWVINDYFIIQLEKQNMNCVTVVANHTVRLHIWEHTLGKTLFTCYLWPKQSSFFLFKKRKALNFNINMPT